MCVGLLFSFILTLVWWHIKVDMSHVFRKVLNCVRYSLPCNLAQFDTSWYFLFTKDIPCWRVSAVPGVLSTNEMACVCAVGVPILKRPPGRLWYRLPRGALPERTAAVPRHARAAAWALLWAHQANIKTRASQSWRAGNQDFQQNQALPSKCPLHTPLPVDN